MSIIREEIFGPDHPEVARSLLYIVSQGRLWAPFEPYFEAHDGDEAATAAVQLAWIERLGYDLATARPKLERLLDSYEDLAEPDEERLLTWLRLLDGHLRHGFSQLHSLARRDEAKTRCHRLIASSPHASPRRW